MSTLVHCKHCQAAFDEPAKLKRHLEREHGPDGEESPEHIQERVDEESMDSFPASDPPSSTPIQRVGKPADPHPGEG